MLQVVLVDGTIWEKVDSLGTMVAKRVRMVCTGITPVGATGSRSPKSQEKHSKECSAEYYPIWRMTITLVSVERVGTGFAVGDEWLMFRSAALPTSWSTKRETCFQILPR